MFHIIESFASDTMIIYMLFMIIGTIWWSVISHLIVGFVGSHPEYNLVGY